MYFKIKSQMPNAPLKTNASDSERRKYVLLTKKPIRKLILIGFL